MILAQCGGCGKRYQVPDTYAGKKMRCKQCSAAVSIPAAPPAEMELPEPEVDLPPPPPPAVEEPAAEAPKPAVKPAGAPGRKPLRLPPRKPLAGGAKKPAFAPRPLGAKKPLAGARPASKVVRKEVVEEALVLEGAAPEGAAGKKKLLVLVAGLVLLLAAGGAGYYFFFGPGAGEAPTGAGVKTAKKAKEDAKKKDEQAKSEVVEGAKVAKEEPPPATAEPAAVEVEKLVEPLKVIPKDAEYVAKIALPELVNLFGLQAALDQAVKENGSAFAEAGFDPKAHLRVVWVAGKISSALPGAEAPAAGEEPPPMVALLEGVFDKEKLIPALQKSKKISTRPKNVGKLEVYDLLGDDGKLEGHGCLLSYEQALLGTGDAFNAALKLLEGGESVTANPDLKEISGDFGAKGLLWAAVQLRPEVLAAMKQNFPPEGPPFPELRGFLLGLDRSGDDGIAIAADVHCPSPEEAKKTQGFLGPMLAMYKMSMPEPVKAILDKVKLATAGKAVKLSLDLSGDDLEQLKGMAGMMAGAPPPGAVPVEAEEEEETDEAAPAEEPDAKAKEEPAAEEEPVKEEPEEPPAEEPPAKKVPAKGKKK